MADTMTKCNACGAEMDADETECPSCGAPVPDDGDEMGEKSLPKAMPMQFRSLDLRDATIDENSRTLKLSFSSDTPIERGGSWWKYTEILDHDPKSVRMDRLKSGTAPLLLVHNSFEIENLVGVVESAEVKDGMGRATVRFGTDEDANKAWHKVVVDKTLRNVSVGYIVHRWQITEGEDNTPDEYRAIDWEPVEVSLVPVPADAKVGVGRSARNQKSQLYPVAFERRDLAATADTHKENHSMATPAVTPAAPAVDINAVRNAEVTRVRDIQSVSARFAKHVKDGETDKWINEGISAETVRHEVAGRVLDDAAKPKPATVMLSPKERQIYRMSTAIRAAAGKVGACFEREVSDELSKQLKRETSGSSILIPISTRTLNITTATEGKETVATELRELIDFLKNRLVLFKAGTRMLAGLQGNVAFPRQTAIAVSAMKDESADAATGDATFDQVLLSPKRTAVQTSYTDLFLAQSTLDVEGFVRNDLGFALAAIIDLMGLLGDGNAPNPKGILNQTGIGSEAMILTNSSTISKSVILAETDVAASNADVEGMATVTTPEVRGFLKGTPWLSNTAGVSVWSGPRDKGEVNGYNAFVTNQLRKTVNGNEHDYLFGNFADAMIGLWDGVEVIADPYTRAAKGEIVVTAHQLFDVAVRHAKSFCKLTAVVPA